VDELDDAAKKAGGDDDWRAASEWRARADTAFSRTTAVYNNPTRSIRSGRLFFTLPTSPPTSQVSIAPS
jgi:hypothetical protein